MNYTFTPTLISEISMIEFNIKAARASWELHQKYCRKCQWLPDIWCERGKEIYRTYELSVNEFQAQTV